MTILYSISLGEKTKTTNSTAVDYSSSTNILILVYFVHPIIWTFSLYINSGCGKREEHNNIWSMVMQGQHPLLELP